MDSFEHIAAEMEHLEDAPARIAARAADGVLGAVKSTFAHGRIRGLIVNTTVRAEGSSIVLDLDPRLPVEAIHADTFAETWEVPIKEASAEELGS